MYGFDSEQMDAVSGASLLKENGVLLGNAQVLAVYSLWWGALPREGGNINKHPAMNQEYEMGKSV